MSASSAGKDSCYGIRALDFCHTLEESGIKRLLRVKEYIYIYSVINTFCIIVNKFEDVTLTSHKAPRPHAI